MSTEQCVLKPKVACFWVIKSRVLPRKRLVRQLTNHKAVVCFAGRNHGRSGIAMPAAFSIFVFSFLWIEMSLLGQACVYLHKIYYSWFKKKPSTICQAWYITEYLFKVLWLISRKGQNYHEISANIRQRIIWKWPRTSIFRHLSTAND